MDCTPIDPPRVFRVGKKEHIALKDCARIRLESDEQVTFVTAEGAEYDVVKKSWGFYATPSLNGRLIQFGLKAALTKSLHGKYYLMLVQKGCEQEFLQYLEKEEMSLVQWMDDDQKLAALEKVKP